MKISIITPCYNSAETLEATILSVMQQDYKEVEYILIDGGSTDATLDVAAKYAGFISRLISEKDAGIYDAMNKGIALATGEIVGILNSDDFYTNNQVLSAVVREFSGSGAEALYGDLRYVDRRNTAKTIRYWKAGTFRREKFLQGWMPPHPTFFVKRECYTTFGNYRSDFRSSADYELMLRFLYRHQLSTTYLPTVLVHMRIGGQSNVSIKNRIAANREDKRAWEVNGLTPARFTFIQKPLSKVLQWFLR